MGSGESHIAKRGPVSYKVRVRGQVQRRHIDQLKKRLVDVKVSPGNVDPSDDFLSFPSVHLHSEPLTATEQQYPIRENQRPPQRFRT